MKTLPTISMPTPFSQTHVVENRAADMDANDLGFMGAFGVAYWIAATIGFQFLLASPAASGFGTSEFRDDLANALLALPLVAFCVVLAGLLLARATRRRNILVGRMNVAHQKSDRIEKVVGFWLVVSGMMAFGIMPLTFLASILF